MKIYVTGTLADPKASNQAFPEINQALQAFQSSETLFPQARENSVPPVRR
jgi:hypothetical protein